MKCVITLNIIVFLLVKSVDTSIVSEKLLHIFIELIVKLNIVVNRIDKSSVHNENAYPSTKNKDINKVEPPLLAITLVAEPSGVDDLRKNVSNINNGERE